MAAQVSGLNGSALLPPSPAPPASGLPRLLAGLALCGFGALALVAIVRGPSPSPADPLAARVFMACLGATLLGFLPLGIGWTLVARYRRDRLAARQAILGWRDAALRRFLATAGDITVDEAAVFLERTPAEARDDLGARVERGELVAERHDGIDVFRPAGAPAPNAGRRDAAALPWPREPLRTDPGEGVIRVALFFLSGGAFIFGCALSLGSHPARDSLQLAAIAAALFWKGAVDGRALAARRTMEEERHARWADHVIGRLALLRDGVTALEAAECLDSGIDEAVERLDAAVAGGRARLATTDGGDLVYSFQPPADGRPAPARPPSVPGPTGVRRYESAEERRDGYPPRPRRDFTRARAEELVALYKLLLWLVPLTALALCAVLIPAPDCGPRHHPTEAIPGLLLFLVATSAALLETARLRRVRDRDRERFDRWRASAWLHHAERNGAVDPARAAAIAGCTEEEALRALDALVAAGEIDHAIDGSGGAVYRPRHDARKEAPVAF